MRCLFLCFVLLAVPVVSQTVNKNFITKSGQYYYGTGRSQDAREAHDQALAAMTGQIAVKVTSSFEMKIQSSSRGGSSSHEVLDEDIKSILRTHSLATLQDVHRINRPLPSGEVEVFCYLKKSEVAKIFHERKKLIASMANQAQEYERVGNFAFALKLYYFGTLLLNSLPEQNSVYDDVNYTTFLPARINDIIHKISFTLYRDEKISPMEREITLRITHNGSPVATLDFTFWHGDNQVNVKSNDGFATCRLVGSSSQFKSLKLNIKYAYYESREEYKAIEDLWSLVNRPFFPASKTLDLRSVPADTKTQLAGAESSALRYDATEAVVGRWNLNLEFDGKVPVADRITNSTIKLLGVLADNKSTEIKRYYNNDPFLYNKITNYVKWNHPKAVDRTIPANVRKSRSGYELRKVRVLHDYPSINQHSTEYLVLDFSHKGELVDFNTSINDAMYKDLMTSTVADANGISVDERNRHEIIKFIEKYRTAYLTRDLETVDNIFAEDAIILIGRMIKRRKLPENSIRYSQLAAEPDYETLRLNKRDYLSRQRRIFEAQKDISLDFGSMLIKKKNNSRNIYGVEMRQSYTSTTYADEGYLFLMVDFNQRDPIIHVRAWQPQEWNENALVKLGNFHLHTGGMTKKK